MEFIFLMFIVSMLINIIMFIPAFLLQTDKLTDISYAVTFLVVAGASFLTSEKNLGHLMLLVIVSLWAIRLGWFLLTRINRNKVDKRFDGMREKFSSFVKFWILQGASVFIILVPSIIFWSIESPKINLISYLGFCIFAAGLIIESVADHQKSKFKISGQSGWIDTGIWRISRHPNYLGEIMVWLGVYIFAFSSFTFQDSIISLIGPLYITTLLLFISGIPLLEKSSDRKWSNDNKYQDYKKMVPILLPTISSVKRLFNENRN